MRRLHLRVTGRVQGVYYRASAREQAMQLDLEGWVRNCPDGSVELVAEGPKPALELLLAWCESGPPAARVESLTPSWAKASGEFAGFTIRR